MDIIQKIMTLFDSLVLSVKKIANLLTYNYLPATSDEESTRGLFWIFNW